MSVLYTSTKGQLYCQNKNNHAKDACVRAPVSINPHFFFFMHMPEMSIKVEDLHKKADKSTCVGVRSPATSQQL